MDGILWESWPRPQRQEKRIEASQVSLYIPGTAKQ